MKRIAVLGATGSIGTNCLEVVARHHDRMRAAALTAHRNWSLLAEQCRRFRPRWAVVGDAALRDEVDRRAFPVETELLFGPEAVERVASESDVDVVVAAIVGAAGLRGTWAALESGKTIALANKETLVVAGALARKLARRTGATLLPVDSEHSAVFQALQAGRPEEVRRIVLTASGGPFRGWPAGKLAEVTPEMALAHPTWNMGRKITVDSATLMNKALEVIEAKWLFDLEPERIEVVVHPQSIVHSFVEFVDGSVIAQLSPPDMKLPIQYALTYPERLKGLSPAMDWKQAAALTFEPPDLDAFPALALGFEVARRGGSCGAVLNAANEAAVERFLAGELRFVDIPRACRAVLEAHDFDPEPSLAELLRHDARARQEIQHWTS
ncbi:MAG: 1-deoxy-D-xylulose-5-phosphate reductoisomerase [Planctomycetales bacterium]